MRADLRLPVDPKVSGLIDGGFDPQNTALFVVHFDGVGIEAVFDPNAFGPFFQVADHFTLKVASYFSMSRHLMAQKTHDVGAGETGDGVADQRWINLGQRLGALEHHVGGPLALVGGPVVASARLVLDRGQGGVGLQGERVQGLRNVSMRMRHFANEFTESQRGTRW